MNKRWLIMLLGILGIVTIFELFNNPFSLMMLLIGAFALFLRNRVEEQGKRNLLFVSIASLILAMLSSRVLWLVLVVVLVLLVGEFSDLFRMVRQAVTDKKAANKHTEFVMVRFNGEEQEKAKIVRNRWFGENTETADDIYSWEDINFTKVAGNTLFDLGNTILPKEQNIILIRKGIGNTKILVPEGVAISLDISLLLGELKIDQDEMTLKNETFRWKSENYSTQARKIKVVANVFVGEVEVVFL